MHPESTRIKLHNVVFAITLLAALGVGGFYAWSGYRRVTQETECKNRLRSMYNAAFQQDSTLVETNDVYSLSKWREGVECSCCGGPFGYRAFPGKVKMQGKTADNKQLFRMIGWCPKPCHGNHRVVLLENGAVHLFSQSAFQKVIEADYLCENRGAE